MEAPTTRNRISISFFIGLIPLDSFFSSPFFRICLGKARLLLADSLGKRGPGRSRTAEKAETNLGSAGWQPAPQIPRAGAGGFGAFAKDYRSPGNRLILKP